MKYRTWDQWQLLGYHVIKGMKATWMYLEEYGERYFDDRP